MEAKGKFHSLILEHVTKKSTETNSPSTSSKSEIAPKSSAKSETKKESKKVKSEVGKKVITKEDRETGTVSMKGMFLVLARY